MRNYIEAFAVPIIGKHDTLENGHDILISARLLTKGSPYNIVTHIDPKDKDRSINETIVGTLLMEARVPTSLEDGCIAYCVLGVDQGNVQLLEMEVLYPYRGNRIIEALVEHSDRMTGTPVVDLSEDAFKYL